MSTLAEIEDAITKLPTPLVDELAAWLEAYRSRSATHPHVEKWLESARGAARPGETTADVMALTRSDE